MVSLDTLAIASNFSHFSGPNNPLLDLGNFLASDAEGSFALLTHDSPVRPDFERVVHFPVWRELLGGPSRAGFRTLTAPANTVRIHRVVSRARPEHVIVFSSVDTAFEASWAMRRRILLGHNVLLNAPVGRVLRADGGRIPAPRLRDRVVFGGLDRIAAASVVDRILAHTEFHRREYMSLGIPADRITIIPHCIDARRIREAADTLTPFKVDSEVFSLLFVGRLEPEKGISELLEAVVLASRETPVELRIVGTGSLFRKVSSAVQAHNAEHVPVINWYPEMALPTLARMICDSQAVAIPSYEEPFGMVALEAMALGTPVIGVRRGGLAEVVRDREEGLMVEA